MGWLFNRSTDQQLAATKYQGRESASETAAKARRAGHRRSLLDAARQGQAWEDRDRQAERRGGWRRTTW